MKDPNVAQRPSLTGLSIVDEMEKVLAERLPLYHDAAHHIVNVEQDEALILNNILHMLQN